MTMVDTTSTSSCGVIAGGNINTGTRTIVVDDDDDDDDSDDDTTAAINVGTCNNVDTTDVVGDDDATFLSKVSDTCTSACCSLLLEFLPRELLMQSILARYLDGNALANFWCATITISTSTSTIKNKSKSSSNSSTSSLSMMQDMIQIIQYRRSLLVEERDSCDDDNNDNNNDNGDQCYLIRRQVFKSFEDAASIPVACIDEQQNTISLNNCNSEEVIIEDDYTYDSSDSENKHNCHGSVRLKFVNFLRFSRRFFGNLSAMDYCERVPYNLIWCGVLQIRDGRRPPTLCTRTTAERQEDDRLIRVVLVVHPRRWSMKEIRLWRNATTTALADKSTTRQCSTAGIHPTIKLDVIPHNFLPVGPNRGRLVGVTKSDRRSLRRISKRLDENELVARYASMITSTNSSSNTPVDTTGGGQFVVKLTSFAQAQRKLDTIFSVTREPGGIPLSEEKDGMILNHHHQHHKKDEKYGDDDDDRYAYNDDQNSLLCCWNHEFLWENSRSFQMQTSYALRDTMQEYDKIVI